jgi:hypothetical protein
MVLGPIQPPEQPEDLNPTPQHLPLDTINQDDQIAFHVISSLHPAPYPPQLMNTSNTSPSTSLLPPAGDMSTTNTTIRPGPDSPQVTTDDFADLHRRDYPGDDSLSPATVLAENAGKNFVLKQWGIMLTLPRSYSTKCRYHHYRYDCSC